MRSHSRELAGIALGVGLAVVMWLWPPDLVPTGLRTLLLLAGLGLVAASLILWARAGIPVEEAPMTDDAGKSINISSTNQSGGFTGILVQGNVRRQLDDSLRAQLLSKLPKGKVGVMSVMGVPDGDSLASQIAGFLSSQGYTIEHFGSMMLAGAPAGISIQKFENTPSVVINHA